jgi:hypothetical protein
MFLMKILWIELNIITGLHTFFGRICRKLSAKRNKICKKIFYASLKKQEPVKIYFDEFIDGSRRGNGANI